MDVRRRSVGSYVEVADVNRAGQYTKKLGGYDQVITDRGNVDVDVDNLVKGVSGDRVKFLADVTESEKQMYSVDLQREFISGKRQFKLVEEVRNINDESLFLVTTESTSFSTALVDIEPKVLYKEFSLIGSTKETLSTRKTGEFFGSVKVVQSRKEPIWTDVKFAKVQKNIPKKASYRKELLALS